MIQKLLYLCAIFASISDVMAGVNITMWQADLQHSGLNLNETLLTPVNVGSTGSFGCLFSQPLDGQTYGQPLLISGLMIGGTMHNVVYVATEHDSVYAFDADSNTNGNDHPLWHDSLVPAGTRPVPQGLIGSSDISVEIGITTTPVIDAASHTIYVVSKVQTVADGICRQYLHALDLATGAEKFGSPALINPTFNGSADDGKNGVIPFDALRENLRSAMLLYKGVIYICYASLSDINPYHGEIVGYNASNLALVYGVHNRPERQVSGSRNLARRCEPLRRQ